MVEEEREEEAFSVCFVMSVRKIDNWQPTREHVVWTIWYDMYYVDNTTTDTNHPKQTNKELSLLVLVEVQYSRSTTNLASVSS